MNDDQHTAMISVARLKALEESERILIALEAAGVDNWEGYDDALTMVEYDD